MGGVMPGNIVVLGISGKAGAGKDAYCQALQRVGACAGVPVTRRALGDSLKGELAWFLAEETRNHPDYCQMPPAVRQDEFRAILSGTGPQAHQKEHYRSLMQWWGTEFRRRLWGEDYWCLRWMEWFVGVYGAKPGIIVIPDVRFSSEVRWLGSFVSSYTVRIVREAAGLSGSASEHSSETELDTWDRWDEVVRNYGDLDDLQQMAQITLEKAWPARQKETP